MHAVPLRKPPPYDPFRFRPKFHGVELAETFDPARVEAWGSDNSEGEGEGERTGWSGAGVRQEMSSSRREFRQGGAVRSYGGVQWDNWGPIGVVFQEDSTRNALRSIHINCGVVYTGRGGECCGPDWWTEEDDQRAVMHTRERDSYEGENVHLFGDDISHFREQQKQQQAHHLSRQVGHYFVEVHEAREREREREKQGHRRGEDSGSPSDSEPRVCDNIV